MSSVVFHPEAERDLNEIWDYISTDSVEAADRVLSDIEEKIRSLQ
jgi:plasmid stabilization system protein ParE